MILEIPFWVVALFKWTGLVVAFLLLLAIGVVCVVRICRQSGLYWVFVFMLTMRSHKRAKDWSVMQMMHLRDGLEEDNPELLKEFKEVWK